MNIIKIPSETAKDILRVPSLNICSYVSELYCDKKQCDNIYSIGDRILTGNNAFGYMYDACLDDSCDYIAKWQKITSEQNLNDIKKEATTQHLLGEKGLAPKVKQLLICPEGGIIIMEKMSFPVSSKFITLSKKQIREAIGNFNKRINKQCLAAPDIENMISNYSDLYLVKDIINETIGFTIENIEITSEDTDDVKRKRTNYLDQIFDLLTLLNKMGYRHGDAHLDNFMFDAQGNIKIIDFGTIGPSNFDSLEYDINDVLFDLQKRIDDGLGNLQYLYNYTDDYMNSLHSFIRPPPEISEFEPTQPEFEELI
jgi:serine/threonine protein kinase